MSAHDYEVISIDRSGANAQGHPNAVCVEPVRLALNEAGRLVCEVPVAQEANPEDLAPLTRELQLWRAGKLQFQGPITNRRCVEKLRKWEVTAEGLLWYFSKRYFGKPARNNWLTNGSFDTGNLAGWTAAGVTANVVTEWGALPSQTYQLNLYQANPGVDTHVHQTIPVVGGQLWTISAWFQIRTDAAWAGPALDGRGLYVERRHPDTSAVEEVQFFAITDETPRGVFQRATLSIFTPPGRNSVLDIRLYAPAVTNPTPVAPRPPGGIIWDDVSVTLMESTSYPYADMATILNGIVAHAQDPAYGKSNLNIGGGATATGRFLDRTFQHVEHREIGAALREFADAGLCDIEIELSNLGATRLLRCYAPRKAVPVTGAVLEFGPNGIYDASVGEDGGATVTTTIVQGDGTGPERDEAGYNDTSATGGLVLENVLQAESGTHHDLLPGIARAYGESRRTVPQIPELTVSGSWLDRIELGSVIPVDISEGFPVNASYRVVGMDIDTLQDKVTLAVNPA